MSKSDVSILGLYKCIFQDAACAYPALERELSKDYSSLRRLVETRGLRSLTIDLCAAAKHFDRCLASGKYIPPGLPLTKRIGGANMAPRFLGGLFLLVFDEDGSLKEFPCVVAIQFIRQIYLFCKKAAYPCAQEDINREVKRLLDHDALLPQLNPSWNSEKGNVYAIGFAASYRERIRSEDAHSSRQDVEELLGILDVTSGILTSTLGSFDPSEWRFRHGPGAVSEGSRFVNKYCWLNWEPILDSEFPLADYGYHNFASWSRSVQLDEIPGEDQVSSRLVAVPKTVDTPRLIAAEPASKQWCQQSLLAFFVSRTENSWIGEFVRFSDQTQNQAMCRKGSLDGSLCTIDLSAASDSVSCEFVGNLFRCNHALLRCLRAVRTRHLSQNLDESLPEVTCLNKYSMMGSAVTFPIESLGFLAICISGVLHSRCLKPTLRNIKALVGEVSVFGDDLVIPKDSWDSVVILLEACSFQVNSAKSFSEGNFRESCGLDAFRGVGITPTYWRGPYTEEPESVVSRIELHNHLYDRWLMHTACEVRKSVRDFPSKTPHSGAVGLHSRPAVELSVPNRYCNAHQVWKVRVLTIQSQKSSRPFHDDCAIFQYFTDDPSPFTKWKGGLQSRSLMRIRPRWVPVADLVRG